MLCAQITCAVCAGSVSAAPELCANYRGNPSVVLRVRHPDGRQRHVQVSEGPLDPREFFLNAWCPHLPIRADLDLELCAL